MRAIAMAMALSMLAMAGCAPQTVVQDAPSWEVDDRPASVAEPIEEHASEALAEPIAEEPMAEDATELAEPEWCSEQAEYVPMPCVGSGDDFQTAGVVYDGGTTYTWYGQGTLPGGGLTELNENGRTVNDEGFITDGDGYLAVASSDYPIGTHLDTPWGEGIVYDTGCPSGTVDMYTDWG